MSGLQTRLDRLAQKLVTRDAWNTVVYCKTPTPNTPEEDAAIARFIATHGVTRIEPRTVEEVIHDKPYRMTRIYEGLFQ